MCFLCENSESGEFKASFPFSELASSLRVLSCNHNAQQFILITCNHSQRAKKRAQPIVESEETMWQNMTLFPKYLGRKINLSTAVSAWLSKSKCQCILINVFLDWFLRHKQRLLIAWRATLDMYAFTELSQLSAFSYYRNRTPIINMHDLHIYLTLYLIKLF